MGAGAGQTGGGMQTMPQMAMPQGGPTQSGLGALATQMQQNGQADPRLMAMMQAFQNQGGMPGAGMMPPGGMPTQQTQQAMLDQIRQTSPAIGLPGMPMRPTPGIAAPGGVRFTPELQSPVGPGDVLVQRPLPVGAGGKGTGMPPPGMVNPPRPGVPVQRPMPMPPGVNRPMPAPMPPGLNRPMPMPMPKPAPQPVRPTPKPVNPRFNQIMPFLR